MLKKLKRKFILYTMTIFGVIVAVVCSGIYYSVQSQTEMRANRTLEEVMSRNIAQDIFIEFRVNGTKPFDTRWAFKVTSDGVVIGSQYEITDSFVQQLVKLSTKETGYLQYEGHIFKYLVKNSEYAFVNMTYDLNRVNETLGTVLLISAVAMIFVFISSNILASWALKPVEVAWQKQKEFISDASHELRTPIAVISANAQLLKDHPDDLIKQQIKFVNYIHEEAKRMTELVERLLFLAKSDQTKQKLNLETVNLSDIVYEVALPLESVSFEQNKSLNLEIEQDVMIKGDTAQLKQLLVILLDNAIKYSPTGEMITISLAKQGILKVQNYGEVIPEDKLNHLFDRFYRVDESRQRETQGYGLGLSIAKTIVETHKAKIDVQSTEKNGTVFTVSFTK